jgi:hypothetical protein
MTNHSSAHKIAEDTNILQGFSVKKCIAAVVPLLLFLGGVETGLIFALKEAKSRGLEWPLILMAVLSASLLAAGVLRHYWDIYVHRTVRGISFFFVGIDAAGDLFSLVSVGELFGILVPSLSVSKVAKYGCSIWPGYRCTWYGYLRNRAGPLVGDFHLRWDFQFSALASGALYKG